MGFLVPTGCFSCGPLPNPGCISRVPDTCVFHFGSSIVGPGINTGDNLSTILTKLVTYINNFFTTTTTTTSTTTTTTTSA